MKEVIVTGASGFIGREVMVELKRRGWSAIGVSRDPVRAARSPAPAARWIALDSPDLDEELRRVGRCINLAGQHPFERRWSTRYKALLWASRIDTTTRVARAIAASTAEGRALISTSGTGVYGDCGVEPFGEERARGPKWFLADMEEGWEAAAMAAESSGGRVAVMRVGLSLGRGGGALAILEENFQRGMGGHVGTGRQFVPWIHNLDCARMYVDALEGEQWRGAFNCVGPAPRTFEALCAQVGAALGRRSWFHAPPLIARLMIGEASAILLESVAALPRKASSLGFSFVFPTLEATLGDLYRPAAPTAPVAAQKEAAA